MKKEQLQSDLICKQTKLIANLDFQRRHNYEDCDCKLQRQLEDSSFQEIDLRECISTLTAQIEAENDTLKCFGPDCEGCRLVNSDTCGKPIARESNTESAELADDIENIFKNTYRIHGNSDALDWFKIAAHKAATYLKVSGKGKALENRMGRDEIKQKLECATCVYNEGESYHDKMWCRDCRQKDRHRTSKQ